MKKLYLPMMVVLFLTACGNEPTQELVQTDT